MTVAERFDHLDGLRGVAALAVVVHHGALVFDMALYSGLPADSRNGWDLALSAWPLLPAMWGNISVCVFFALSGFVLCHSYQKTRLGWPALIAKRYLRLTPPIVVACVLGWLAYASGLSLHAAYLRDMPNERLAQTVVADPHLPMALAQGLLAVVKSQVGPISYNGVLWTMPIEFAGSLALIALFAIARSRFVERTGRTRTVLIASLAIFTLLFSQSYLGLFGLGALFRVLCPSGVAALQRTVPGRMAGLALMALGLLLGTIPVSPLRPALFDAMDALRLPLPPMRWGLDATASWHALGAVALLMAVLSTPWLRRAFLHPFAQWLGRLSFPLYLVHVPLIPIAYCGGYLLARGGGLSPGGAGVVGIVCLVAASMAVAEVFSRLVERPVIALSNQAGVRVDGWVRGVGAKAGRMWQRVTTQARPS